MEAAVVMPILMLAVITVILILLFFYHQGTEQSRMHMALRQEAGNISGHTRYLHDSGYSGELSCEKKAGDRRICGSETLIMKHRGILYRNGRFTINGEAYVVDGTAYVRFCEMVKGMRENEAEGT